MIISFSAEENLLDIQVKIRKHFKFYYFSFISKNINKKKEFFKRHPTPQANKAIQQGLESLRTKITWLQLQTMSLKEFLDNQS